MIISIGILIIVGVGFGMLYVRESKSRNALDEQLTSVQARLNGINIEKQLETERELKKQQAEILLAIEPLQQTFSHSLSSVEVTDRLFEIGTASNVSIISVTSPEPGAEIIDGVTYLTLTSVISVKGTLNRLISYVSALNSHFITGVTKDISIVVPDSEAGEIPSAEITLILYRNRSIE